MTELEKNFWVDLMEQDDYFAIQRVLMVFIFTSRPSLFSLLRILHN